MGNSVEMVGYSGLGGRAYAQGQIGCEQGVRDRSGPSPNPQILLRMQYYFVLWRARQRPNLIRFLFEGAKLHLPVNEPAPVSMLDSEI